MPSDNDDEDTPPLQHQAVAEQSSPSDPSRPPQLRRAEAPRLSGPIREASLNEDEEESGGDLELFRGVLDNLVGLAETAVVESQKTERERIAATERQQQTWATVTHPRQIAYLQRRDLMQLIRFVVGAGTFGGLLWLLHHIQQDALILPILSALGAVLLGGVGQVRKKKPTREDAEE